MSLKILLALKPGDSHTDAVTRAQSLASGTDVDVLLYSAVFDHAVEHSASLDQPVRQEIIDGIKLAEQWVLEAVAETLRPIAKTVDVRIDWLKDAPHAVADAAEQHEADLIIVSSPHHSSLARAFFNYNDLQIPRHTRIPVLLAVNGEHQSWNSVLVGVQLSREDQGDGGLDRRLVDQGRRYAAVFDAELHVIHAYPSIVALQPMSFGEYLPPPSLYEELKEKHQSALQQFLAAENLDAEHGHLDERSPGVALAAVASQQGCGLLVLGLHTRGKLDSLLVTDTAEHLLSHPPCDLLLCR